MRRGWMLLLGMIVVAYFATDAMVSTLTLKDLVSRPITGFEREVEDSEIGSRVETLRIAEETDFFGKQAEGTVRHAGGVGTLLGYRHRFRLPDGAVFSCTHILRWMRCERGWHPVRPEPSG